MYGISPSYNQVPVSLVCNAAIRNKPSNLTKDGSGFVQEVDRSVTGNRHQETINLSSAYTAILCLCMKYPTAPIKPPTLLPYDHSGPTEGAVDIYKVTKAEASAFPPRNTVNC